MSEFLSAGELSVQLSEVGPLEAKNAPIEVGNGLGVIDVVVVEGHALLITKPFPTAPAAEER